MPIIDALDCCYVRNIQNPLVEQHKRQQC